MLSLEPLMIDKDSTQRAVSQFSMWSVSTPGAIDKGSGAIRQNTSSARNANSRNVGGAISPVS